MARVKIVVWDNIGNTLLGVRPWSSWPLSIRQWLIAEDPEAEAHAPSFDQLFAGYDVDLHWFVSEEYGPGFGTLAQDFAAALRPHTRVDQITAAIADADHVVIHKQTLPAAAVRGASKLRLLQHLGQDYRGVPLDAARERGIPVAATPLVNYLAVAEHVWALILNHLKRLPILREHIHQRKAYGDDWSAVPHIGLARDQTLGLLGFGEIARPVARIARAFEMPVLYWDIVRFPELEEEYGASFVAWDEIFRRSDILSVHLALNERTAGIIGAREIGLMPPHALFINTARGKLVDQVALTAALAAGRLGGAALDVFNEEPLPHDDPLHTLHKRMDGRVTLTPHIGWQSPWTWVRDSHELWHNVLRSLRGEPVRHLVTGQTEGEATLS